MWAQAKGFLWADFVHSYKVTMQGFIKHSSQLGPKLEALLSEVGVCSEGNCREEGMKDEGGYPGAQKERACSMILRPKDREATVPECPAGAAGCLGPRHATFIAAAPVTL